MPLMLSSSASPISNPEMVPGPAPTERRMAISLRRSFSPERRAVIIPKSPASTTKALITRNPVSAVRSSSQSS